MCWYSRSEPWRSNAGGLVLTRCVLSVWPTGCADATALAASIAALACDSKSDSADDEEEDDKEEEDEVSIASSSGPPSPCASCAEYFSVCPTSCSSCRSSAACCSIAASSRRW